MILQTHTYYVPREKRNEHQRLVLKIREELKALGVASYNVFEQAGPDWGPEAEPSNRFVQVVYFTDVRHQKQVQQAEKASPSIQRLISEFCDLISLPDQQATGLFLTGYYRGIQGNELPTE